MRFLKRTSRDPAADEARRAFEMARVALDESRLEEAEAGFRRAIELGHDTPATSSSRDDGARRRELMRPRTEV